MENINGEGKAENRGKRTLALTLGFVFLAIIVVFSFGRSSADSSLGAGLLNFLKGNKGYAKDIVAKIQKEKSNAQKLDVMIRAASERNKKKIAALKNYQDNRGAPRKTGTTYGNPPPTAACAILTQQDFDQANGDIVLDFTNGCYQITTNIQFDYTLIVQGGSADSYFTCNGFEITKKTETGALTKGIIVRGSNTVKSCKVAAKSSGFFVIENGIVMDSSASSNTLDGFYVSDNGHVIRGYSVLNNSGFSLFSFQNYAAQVEDSRSLYNFVGFSVADYSLVKNSFAIGNQIGFWVDSLNESGSAIAMGNSVIGAGDAIFGFLVKDGRVTNNVVRNVGAGFYIEKGDISFNTADSNSGVGFNTPGGNGINFEANIATNNPYGFVIRSGVVNFRSNVARNNTVGFFADSNTLIESSIAESNEIAGFVTSGNLENSNARNHSTGVGIVLENGSIGKLIYSNNNKDGVFVNSGALLRDGVEMCNNAEYGIFVNDGGTVSGTFRSDKQIQGGGNWNEANIVPCGGGGGKEFYQQF